MAQQNAWGSCVSPVVEEGGRAWHGEIPQDLISVQAQADVLHLPEDQFAPAAVHRGSGGPLLLAGPCLSGTFPQHFCCILPSLMLPAPGQPLAQKPSHPSPKTSCFMSPLEHSSGLHAWQREAGILYKVVTGQGWDKHPLAFGM